jgi:hypothetical protein
LIRPRLSREVARLDFLLLCAEVPLGAFGGLAAFGALGAWLVVWDLLERPEPFGETAW